jgi:hypothetical protein
MLVRYWMFTQYQHSMMMYYAIPTFQIEGVYGLYVQHMWLHLITFIILIITSISTRVSECLVSLFVFRLVLLRI